MTVGQFKKLIATLPSELDDKPLWYVELDQDDEELGAVEEPDLGIAIVGPSTRRGPS